MQLQVTGNFKATPFFSKTTVDTIRSASEAVLCVAGMMSPLRGHDWPYYTSESNSAHWHTKHCVRAPVASVTNACQLTASLSQCPSMDLPHINTRQFACYILWSDYWNEILKIANCNSKELQGNRVAGTA
jgi:hypothetical protein